MDLEALLIVAIAILIPGVFLSYHAKMAAILYFALFPVYMYTKSMFATVDIAGRQIQWPTLGKDLLCAALILVLIVSGRAWRAANQGQRQLIVLLLAFGACLVLGALAAGDGILGAAMGVRPYILYPLLGVLLGAAYFRSPGSWSTLANAAIIGSLAIACLALVHSYADPFFLVHESLGQLWRGSLLDWHVGHIRLRSYFTSPNTLAFFMVIGILTALWKVIRVGSTQAEKLTILLLPLFFWVLALTLSRAAVLALLAGGFVMVILARPRSAWWLMILAVPMLAGMLVVTGYASRFTDLGSNPRLVIWATFVAQNTKSPALFLLGQGAGQTGRKGLEGGSHEVQVADLAERDDEGYVLTLDNFYVKTFYEAGLLGLMFLLYSLYLAYRSLGFLRQTPERAAERQAFSLAGAWLTFVVVISFFTGSLGTYPWNLFFWLSLATLHGQAGSGQRAEVAGMAWTTLRLRPPYPPAPAVPGSRSSREGAGGGRGLLTPHL